MGPTPTGGHDDGSSHLHGRGPATPSPDGPWYRRLGEVRAQPLTAAREWLDTRGNPLLAQVGDWWVTDIDGRNPRSISNTSFRATHRHLDADRWARTGRVRARRCRADEVVQTQEGAATAYEGDWILTDMDGHRWPVTDEYLSINYQYDGDAPGEAPQAW